MLKDIINKIVKGTKKVAFLPILRTSSGEFLLKKTDFGLIRIDYLTMQKIVERALAPVEGILEPEVAVEKTASTVTPIKVRLTLTMAEGFSAPRISAAAEVAINDALKNLLGLEFYVPVLVKVKQITQPVQTRRRVR